MVANIETPSSDEWSLVHLAVNGDRSAVGILYERYSRELYAFLSARVGANDAEDVLSDVWLRLLKTPPQREDSFRGWLYQVAKNLVMDRHRRKTTSGGTTELQDDVVVDPSFRPDVVIEHKQKETDFRDCLSRLQQEFAVVMSRFLLGEDHATIGEALGIPVGTSQSRLSRGKQNLKQCMNGKGWETKGDAS